MGDSWWNHPGAAVGSFKCSFIAEEPAEQSIRNGHAHAQRCFTLLPLVNRGFTGEEPRQADSNWQPKWREPLATRSERDGAIFDRRNELDQKVTSVAESVQDHISFFVISHCRFKAPLDARKMEPAVERHAGDTVCSDEEPIHDLEWDSVSSLGKQGLRPAPHPQKRSAEPSAGPFAAAHASPSALERADSQLWRQMCVHNWRCEMKGFAQRFGKRRPPFIPCLSPLARFRARSQGRQITQPPHD